MFRRSSGWTTSGSDCATANLASSAGTFYDPPDPTMRGTVADRPAVELVLALVDDDGRVSGNPTRTRVAMCSEEGDFAEVVLDGATTLQEADSASRPAQRT